MPDKPEKAEDIDSLLAEVSALADQAVSDIAGEDPDALPIAPPVSTRRPASPRSGAPPVPPADGGGTDQMDPALVQQAIDELLPPVSRTGPEANPDEPVSPLDQGRPDEFISPLGGERPDEFIPPFDKGGAGGGLLGADDDASHAIGRKEDPERILNLEVPVIVQLAERTMPLADIVNLTSGAIIEFEKPADGQLDLMINNKCIARGLAVKAGENFGLRIQSIGSVRERIRALGRP